MQTAKFVEARIVTHGSASCAYCTKDATYTIATGADPHREPRCDYHTWSTLDVAAGSLNERGRFKPHVARLPPPPP